MSRGLTITLVASVLVLALGVTGLAAYMFWQPDKVAAAEQQADAPPPVKEAEEPAVKVGAFLELKNFVTDLADQDRLRYVQVTLALGFEDDTARKEAEALAPQIRDIILGQLRARVAADLLGPQGKDRLAATLKPALAEVLGERLKAIYITDMVIQ